MPAGVIPQTDEKTTCDPLQHMGILKHHHLNQRASTIRLTCFLLLQIMKTIYLLSSQDWDILVAVVIGSKWSQCVLHNRYFMKRYL